MAIDATATGGTCSSAATAAVKASVETFMAAQAEVAAATVSVNCSTAGATSVRYAVVVTYFGREAAAQALVTAAQTSLNTVGSMITGVATATSNQVTIQQVNGEVESSQQYVSSWYSRQCGCHRIMQAPPTVSEGAGIRITGHVLSNGASLPRRGVWSDSGLYLCCAMLCCAEAKEPGSAAATYPESAEIEWASCHLQHQPLCQQLRALLAPYSYSRHPPL